MRALGRRVAEAYAPGEPVHHVCIAANALGRARVWDQELGAFLADGLAPAATGMDAAASKGLLRACNPVDISQLCYFVSVFHGELRPLGLQLAAFLGRVQGALAEAECKGQFLEPLGLVSLLRSLVRLRSDGVDHDCSPLLCQWLRARLLRELPRCSPRQLASVLLDLQSLSLLDEDALTQVRREVERCWSAGSFRARDLVSIISGLAKLPRRAEENRSFMMPLVPNMLAMLPDCSGVDLCELLHGLASVHLRNRTLLGAWASHFEKFVGSATPTQLSLVSADLAKIRYVQDTKRTFDAVLGSIADVAPKLGGLSVCHVVCAMARVSNQRICVREPELQRLLLYRLEAQLLAHVHDLLPQGLSASAAAFTKLRHYSEEFFDGLATAAVPRFGAFVPEDFAMISSALSVTHQFLQSGLWHGEPLEILGQHAAQSLELGHQVWSPRQVVEVLQPFGVLHVQHRPLMLAVEGHFRSRMSTYAPRDLVRLLHGFRDTGHLGLPQIKHLWGFAHDRLRLFTGPQTIAAAELIAPFRRSLHPSKLRYRFRLLAANLMRTVRDLPLLSLGMIARIWATVGVRDWQLLSAVAGSIAEKFGGDGGDLSSEELSQLAYAYIKLGAPAQVPARFRSSIDGMLVLTLEAFESTDRLKHLDARGLRRLLLAVTLWETPDAAAARDAPGGPDARVLSARRGLLIRGLSALLPLVGGGQPAAADRDAWDHLRLIVASAHLEFSVAPSDFGPVAAARFSGLLGPQLPPDTDPGEAELDRLRPHERSVYSALEGLLREWGAARSPRTAGAEAAILHPVPLCDVRLAVPAWHVALEVGCPEDFFDGASGPAGKFHEEGAADEAAWKPLPALRMRLLSRAGWHVVKIPCFSWDLCVNYTEQRQFLSGQLWGVANKAAAAAPKHREAREIPR